MRSLRILHVTPYAAEAWGYGGIPRVVDVLTRELARLGHSVTVCASDARDADTRYKPASRHVRRGRPAFSPAPGLESRIFPNLSNRLAYRHQLFLPFGLRRYLRESAETFDIAHLHACRNVPGVLAAGALRRRGIPYVLSPHGTAPRIERRQLTKRLFDVMTGNRVMKTASAVLAVSQAERRQLLVCGVPDSRISVLANPIDLSEWRTPPTPERFRARFGLGDRPIVMFLGKLTPRKRLDVVVDAFARLARPDAHLVIAGNDMGVGREIAELVGVRGVGSRVTFTGLLTGKDRLDALSAANVVAYPSSDEVFGLVPVEALLCGTPVVVSDDSGCGEVVEAVGGGRTMPVGDVEGVARALNDILHSQPQWRREAEAAAARIRMTFAGPVIAERVAGLYQDTLSQRPATRYA